jgi:APA family basic amino acid/polyamine antiporter
MLTALVYCELSSRMPYSAGSSYAYIYSTIGELPAWIIGWNMNLRYGATAAALSRGWTSYFVGLFNAFGIILPTALYQLDIFGTVT